MNAAVIAHDAIKEQAATYNLPFLRGLIEHAETERKQQLEIAEISKDYTKVQDTNLVISALVQAAIDQLPELDTAIDEWCAYDYTDRTMAAFVVEWMHENI
jgi:hypothetical protein